MHIYEITEELQNLSSKKRAEIIADTVQLFPYKYPIMENSTENGIREASKGIIEYLQNRNQEDQSKPLVKNRDITWSN